MKTFKLLTICIVLFVFTGCKSKASEADIQKACDLMGAINSKTEADKVTWKEIFEKNCLRTFSKPENKDLVVCMANVSSQKEAAQCNKFIP